MKVKMKRFERGSVTVFLIAKQYKSNSNVFLFFFFFFSGNEWNEPGVRNCSKETMPVNGSTYPSGLPAASMTVQQVLSEISKPIHLLNITTLSQLRKDAHPSSYNGFKGMDCTHWCIAGLPDTWNQLLYAALIS